jgi:4-amino-4-deoxy-L-arabinose transferase-like glycosyltransferase
VTVLVPTPTRQADVRPAVAWAPLSALSAAVALLLLLFAGRYGYHRDELYFLQAGRHPAFGYVDQPPLTPLLAHAIDRLFPGSLIALRVPSALSAGLVVLLTGLTAREFGARRSGQLLAAACLAVGAFPLGVGHLLSTTTFDVLGWTALSWLLVRALRDGGRVWLAAGAVAGLALENKTSPAFLLGALLLGVLISGPRGVFRSPWPWAGAAIALLLWAPNLVWQATHHWPQLRLSASIAAGNSGSSQPRALFIPLQFLLISPPLTPIWIAGLWRLARDRSLVLWRSLPLAYGILVVIFLATGGKPYYLCGMYPALFAAGAEPTLRWAGRVRRRLLAAVVVVSAAVSAVVALPVIPARVLHDTPVLAMNYDAGEQVGWQRFAAVLAAQYDRLPPGPRAHAVVLGGNYGEVGAMLRYRPGVPSYGGHNSMWDLGPPPAATTGVVAVGYPESDLRAWFRRVSRVATFENGVALDNDEQDDPVWLCTGPVTPWSALWPKMRRLG